jgi:hypothetical protein
MPKMAKATNILRRMLVDSLFIHRCVVHDEGIAEYIGLLGQRTHLFRGKVINAKILHWHGRATVTPAAWPR